MRWRTSFLPGFLGTETLTGWLDNGVFLGEGKNIFDELLSEICLFLLLCDSWGDGEG